MICNQLALITLNDIITFADKKISKYLLRNINIIHMFQDFFNLIFYKYNGPIRWLSHKRDGSRYLAHPNPFLPAESAMARPALPSLPQTHLFSKLKETSTNALSLSS